MSDVRRFDHFVAVTLAADFGLLFLISRHFLAQSGELTTGPESNVTSFLPIMLNVGSDDECDS